MTESTGSDTWRNPIPMPTPPTTPMLSWILLLNLSRQPSMLIFMAASVADRSRTARPQPATLERQQESGTLCCREKETLDQSWYSWVPQQSNCSGMRSIHHEVTGGLSPHNMLTVYCVGIKLLIAIQIQTSPPIEWCPRCESLPRSLSGCSSSCRPPCWCKAGLSPVK